MALVMVMMVHAMVTATMTVVVVRAVSLVYIGGRSGLKQCDSQGGRGDAYPLPCAQAQSLKADSDDDNDGSDDDDDDGDGDSHYRRHHSECCHHFPI